MSNLRAVNGRMQEIVVTHCVVRKQTMDGTPLDALVAYLLRENFTGTVTLGVSHGRIRTISAEDRQDVTFET